MTDSACPSCADTGHVCENHPDLPWNGLCCAAAVVLPGVCEHGACGCGGAGMPCPDCCSPIPQDGRRSIIEAFTPDRLRTPASTGAAS